MTARDARYRAQRDEARAQLVEAEALLALFVGRHDDVDAYFAKKQRDTQPRQAEQNDGAPDA